MYIVSSAILGADEEFFDQKNNEAATEIRAIIIEIRIFFELDIQEKLSKKEHFFRGNVN